MVTWGENDQDMAGSYAAMLRAAQRAREIAKQTGTPLVIWRDGRVVLLSPHDLTEMDPAQFQSRLTPSPEPNGR